MKLRTGTSGYAYKEWKGSFYPDDLPATGMLRYYGEHFGSVEINNTFYRMPSREVLAKWAEDVPPDFVFGLKAPQRITHQKRLKDASGEVEYFFDTASVLAERLGPTLFQLPPNAKKDAPRLRSFLEVLPKTRRVAFEFRNISWFDDEVYALLRGAGAALCVAHGEDESLPLDVVDTSNFGYLRLRRCEYDEPAMRDWITKIRSAKWSEVFVFFKHEDEGTGPELATRFEVLWKASSGEISAKV